MLEEKRLNYLKIKSYSKNIFTNENRPFGFEILLIASELKWIQIIKYLMTETYIHGTHLNTLF